MGLRRLMPLLRRTNEALREQSIRGGGIGYRGCRWRYDERL